MDQRAQLDRFGTRAKDDGDPTRALHGRIALFN